MEFCNTVQRFFKETKNDINYSYGLWQKEIYQEEGRMEGKKEGEEIGETKASKQIAINMLASGATLEYISKMTNLSLEDIKKLQENKIP